MRIPKIAGLDAKFKKATPANDDPQRHDECRSNAWVYWTEHGPLVENRIIWPQAVRAAWMRKHLLWLVACSAFFTFPSWSAPQRVDFNQESNIPFDRSTRTEPVKISSNFLAQININQKHQIASLNPFCALWVFRAFLASPGPYFDLACLIFVDFFHTLQCIDASASFLVVLLLSALALFLTSSFENLECYFLR
jgi:hypothetical protein